jgi:hypothetical protein
MCKSAAYISKLLEGYSLIRITYESSEFSADKDKDEEKKQEKAKKYRLMDKIILQIVESVLAASISTLCLIRFDFRKFKNKNPTYQKLVYENPNRSLLYNEAGKPRTFIEVFNNGKYPNMSIKNIVERSNEYELEDKASTDTTSSRAANLSAINSQEPFVTRKRLSPIANSCIGKEPKKLNSGYYFHRNKMSKPKKLSDNASQTEDLKLSTSDLQKKYVKNPYINQNY